MNISITWLRGFQKSLFSFAFGESRFSVGRVNLAKRKVSVKNVKIVL